MKLVGRSFVEWLKPIGFSLISTGAMVIAILIKTYVMVQVERAGFFALIGVGAHGAATLLIDRSAKQEIAAYIGATI